MLPDHYRNPLTDLLFTQAAGFVGLFDVARGWFSDVNLAGCRLLGYSSAADLYAAARPLRAQLAGSWIALPDLSRTAGPQELTVELPQATGELLAARMLVTPLTLDEQPYLLLQLTDAERLHAMERRLAQSVGRFEAVFSHATIGIVVCNPQGTIVLANEQARQQFGYPADSLTGQPIEALVPEAVSQHHAHLRASFNAHPQVRAMGVNRDLQARRLDGSVFPVEISLSFFQLEDELFVVAYIIDITFKREAERELIAQRQRVERLNAELEQKVADRTQALESTLAQLEQRTRELTQALAAEQELGELKSRFVSMASHEFRTPLTAVLTSATLIEKYPATEQQDKRLRHLDRIRTSVKHLTDILEEFLSVGRIEEGRVEAHPTRVELPALLQEAMAEVQGLRKPGQRIETQLTATSPVWLDASLLRKVLVNLLSNALKYSAEDTTVTVGATWQQRRLTLWVQDQGIGISAEDQEHLFERFFRARNATNIPGTGLGLYIIARYLDLLGGTIHLQSELQAGTTVTLTVPYEDHPAD